MQYFVNGMCIARTPVGMVNSEPQSKTHRTVEILLIHLFPAQTACTRRRNRKEDDEMDRMQQQTIAMNMGLQLSSELAKGALGVSACGHHKWLGPHSLRNRIRKHSKRRKVYSVSLNIIVLFGEVEGANLDVTKQMLTARMDLCLRRIPISSGI